MGTKILLMVIIGEEMLGGEIVKRVNCDMVVLRSITEKIVYYSALSVAGKYNILIGLYVNKIFIGTVESLELHKAFHFFDSPVIVCKFVQI